MKKETMPEPITGVYRRPGSTRWQLRIKVPSDLLSLYRTEWACRVSLDSSDLREANEQAAKLWAEWTTRFDEQRKALSPAQAERITPELSQVLAQRVAANLLGRDEKLRSDPELARLLMLTVRDAVPSKLTIRPSSAPAWATDPIHPLDGLPEDLAADLADLNSAMDQQSAVHMSLQRISAVLPMAQAEARKLGVEFDAKTPGALEALRECLRAYRRAWQSIRQRDQGEAGDPATGHACRSEGREGRQAAGGVRALEGSKAPQ